MGKTIIKITDLSDSEIDHALKELKDYKSDFTKKCDELCEKLADNIRDKAQSRFYGAIVDDLTAKSGGPRKANVDVTVSNKGGIYIVSANGEDAVWCEFGSGVSHNGAVGSSPNPYGSPLGFTIGGFGENGKKEYWGFYEDGELRITKGAPATMPMYRAVQSAIQDVNKIAKEVFG